LAALDDVDEVLRAHQVLLGGAPGAPPIANGARLGASLLRASTALISAAIQTEVEETFKAALPLTFDHFSAAELDRYWGDAKRNWGNPNPHNVQTLFFRIGFSDVLEDLSWRKRTNPQVRATLDAINQIRNRVAHGQPLTVDGQPFRLTRPVVVGWTSFARIFIDRFRPHVLAQFE
jgi:hypothetical protein